MNKIIMDENHIYRVDSKVVPGVSELLVEFGLIDENVIKFADPSLGIAVHKACELDDKGILDIDTCCDAVKCRLEQWREFRKTCGGEIITNELPMYSKLGFCGTPDRILSKVGFGFILPDIKTSKTRSRSTKVQLAFYKRLAEENLGTKLSNILEVVLDGESSEPKIIPHNGLVKEESVMRSILNVHYYKESK